MPQQPQTQTAQVQIQYADRQEVSETFADNLEAALVDGPTLRLVFSVNRVDLPIQPGHPVTGKKFTASRLILPSTMLPALVAQLNDLMKRSVVAPAHPGGKSN